MSAAPPAPVVVIAMLQNVQLMADTLRLVREALASPGDPRLVLPDVEATLAAIEGAST